MNVQSLQSLSLTPTHIYSFGFSFISSFVRDRVVFIESREEAGGKKSEIISKVERVECWLQQLSIQAS